MPVIRQLLNFKPIVLGEPLTDMSLVDFSGATAEVRYRIHKDLEILKTDSITPYPYEVLDPASPPNFILDAGEFMSVWTLAPFFVTTDTDVSEIDYWDPQPECDSEGGSDVPVFVPSNFTNSVSIGQDRTFSTTSRTSLPAAMQFQATTDMFLTQIQARATGSVAGTVELEMRDPRDTTVVLFRSPPVAITTSAELLTFDMTGSPRVIAAANANGFPNWPFTFLHSESGATVDFETWSGSNTQLSYAPNYELPSTDAADPAMIVTGLTEV